MRRHRSAIAIAVLFSVFLLSDRTEAGLNLRFWKKDEPQQNQCCQPHCAAPQGCQPQCAAPQYCHPQCAAPQGPYCYGPNQQACCYGSNHGAYCYYQCPPKEKKEKKKCCFRGERPEIAPLVTSVAAAFLNQPAVRVTQDPNTPGVRLRVEAQPDNSDGDGDSTDGQGLQADRPSSSLSKRVSNLEKDLAETTVLLKEISQQLNAIQ